MPFHVRRKDREITDIKDLKEVLKSIKYVTLALCMNNEPYLVSLSHGYDETRNCLYFHCADEGKKLVYLNANNKVWGQAVQAYGVSDECDYAYKSVHFMGTAFRINDLKEKLHGMKVMLQQLSRNPGAKLARIKLDKLAKTSMIRLDISYMTGKKHQYPE